MTEKEFKVRPAPFNLYEIYVENGGEVPKVLQQRFTDPAIARQHINQYKSTRRDYPARGRTKTKGPVNARQKPESKQKSAESERIAD